MTVMKKRVRAKKKNGIKTGINKQTEIVAYCHICNKEVGIIKEINDRTDREIKKICNFRRYPASWFKNEKINAEHVFLCNKCIPGTKAWDEKYPDGELHKTLLNHNNTKKEERKKMMEYSLKELAAVGNELNDVWGLKPAITESNRDELEERLKEEGLKEMAVTPTEDDVANLSKQTLSIMLKLGAVPEELIERVTQKIGKPKKEEDKKVAKKATASKKKAVAKKAPVAKKAETKKAAVPKSDGKRTGWAEGSSANIIHMAVVEAGKSGITRDAVLKKIEKKINSSNPGGRVNTVLKAAIQLSLIKEKDGKFYAV